MTKLITLNDIYSVVNRLEDKMDSRLFLVEGRVDKLEDFSSRLLGIGTIAVIVFSAAFSWVWEKITNGYK